MLEIIATSIALVGSYLVAVKKRSGFIFFFVANMAWICFDIANGHWFQMAMFICFCGTAILGYLNWDNEWGREEEYGQES